MTTDTPVEGGMDRLGGISNSFQICPYIFAPDFYEQQNEESDEKVDVYDLLGAFCTDSLCRR